MAVAPRNTHNKRSLIRTSHVCHRCRVAGRNQQVEEYKHTQTQHTAKKLTYKFLSGFSSGLPFLHSKEKLAKRTYFATGRFFNNLMLCISLHSQSLRTLGITCVMKDPLLIKSYFVEVVRKNLNS